MAESYRVLLTEDAAEDLRALHAFVAGNDSRAKADRLLGRIEATFARLSAFPNRGRLPRELLRVGVRDYREIFFKPYRIVYRVVGVEVIVFLIADGRRDMQSLLSERLLRP